MVSLLNITNFTFSNSTIGTTASNSLGSYSVIYLPNNLTFDTSYTSSVTLTMSGVNIDTNLNDILTNDSKYGYEYYGIVYVLPKNVNYQILYYKWNDTNKMFEYIKTIALPAYNTPTNNGLIDGWYTQYLSTCYNMFGTDMGVNLNTNI